MTYVVDMTECPLCAASPEVIELVASARAAGFGYKRTWRMLRDAGYVVGRDRVLQHFGHEMRTVMSGIADAEDAGQTVPVDYFSRHGIDVPPEGINIRAATVEVRGTDGERHWVRVAPEVEAALERFEIRQAEPVVIEAPRPVPTMFVKGNWRTWVASPDAQIGYWIDAAGNFHSTHDERCFSVGHQIAYAVAEDSRLDGWIDVGDLMDLAAPSRHNPPPIDMHSRALNRAFQRTSEEFARRRHLVGEQGDLVVTSGNHDLRLAKSAAQKEPWLVGVRRAGDPDDEHPVLSVPYLTRSRDYGVEWVPSFPTGYRRLNENLAVFHAPAYGSKALDTARKIAAKIHSSVLHGHTHRREALAENIETVHGVRTMEIWSDGCWARTDGSLPSQSNTLLENGDRMLVDRSNARVGMLSENFHAGMSVIHVEVDGRQRFSAERIAIWDGWANWRGMEFYASCDVDGNEGDEVTGMAA